ncbi:MAG: hypothetical protein Q9208_007984 [Pyrenodesmia sp. 3 TL-2023]
MAPPHLVFMLVAGASLTLVLTFVSLINSHPRQYTASQSSASPEQSRFRSLFSFRTPSALFPSSAIISLTDDNSTFFLARPADFGPSLPSDGLSGQLWVGIGFGDDNLGRGLATDTEGELGCSDVPGWRDGRTHHQGDGQFEPSQEIGLAQPGDIIRPSTSEHSDRSFQALRRRRDLKSDEAPGDDGTDNHLHHPLPASQVSPLAGSARDTKIQQSSNQSPPEHADIQSLQESAEISGKLVLLSRGGCGFLEKVKWVQRRGGAGLIVGDNTRGGALVTMYAKGDTSNITIPALFTSRTTAHLLSSLIPPEAPGDRVETLSEGRGAEVPPHSTASSLERSDDRPTFTQTAFATEPTTSLRSKGAARRPRIQADGQLRSDHNKQSWLRYLFGRKARRGAASSEHGAEADSRSPPSTGRLTWVNEEWTESANTRSGGKSLSGQKASERRPSKNNDLQSSEPQAASDDGFEIGVHDWRDPDLMGTEAARSSAPISRTSTNLPTPTALNRKGANSDHVERLSGGSITPGSGEYQKPAGAAEPHYRASMGSHSRSPEEDEESQGWFRRLLWSDGKTSSPTQLHSSAVNNNGKLEEHRGLWVTLTPTTMSTSPFFDTLLVLVVSPLITLTVHSSRSLLARSRPRSRTTSGIHEAVTESLDEATIKASMKRKEKPTSPGATRRPYHGKQVECVVCLEEYVDGKSGNRTLNQPAPSEGFVDDVQVQAAETSNESPSAAIPIPHGSDDLERGDDMAATLVNDPAEASSSRRGWRGLASFSLSAFSGEAVWRQAQADRDR